MHLAGVDDADGCLAADHLIAHLIDDVSLYERFLVNQILLCLLEFGFIGRVGREARLF